jgi:glutamate synthase domain-containing protein 3
VPGRDRDAEPGAAREVRGDAGDGRGVPVFVAEEVRSISRRSGSGRFEEAVGASTCSARAHGRARGSCSTSTASSRGRGRRRYGGRRPSRRGGELDERLAADAAPALEGSAVVELRYPITNRDRTVGARLGGSSGAGSARAAAGRVRAHFAGTAGQSFGAFLAAGVELRLDGEANDCVGKSMSGGRIVVSPPPDDARAPCLVGNTVLYGATGGELFCAGAAGERFAVRNSGAVAVVEDVGDTAAST